VEANLKGTRKSKKGKKAARVELNASQYPNSVLQRTLRNKAAQRP